MNLLNDAQLLKAMINVGQYYPKLVKGFVINLPSGFNGVESGEYTKVHVRGYFFALFLIIINEYLGHGRPTTNDHFPILKTVAREITRNEHEEGLSNGLLVIINLSVKYIILYKN